MSPIYEEEGRYTQEDLFDLRKRNKCKECGSRLDVFKDLDSGKAFLACVDWRRTHHEGIEREASRYERQGIEALNISKRREIVAEEHGKEKTKALSRYIGTGAMTKAIASEIVETLWGEAPPIEKGKAILLCSTYQLNPLMKHLYLVPYKKKDREGKYIMERPGVYALDWSMQMGIGATRLLAQRKHNFSYLDMSPRQATPEEVKKILGDTADPNSVYGFVHIKDVDTLAEAFGLRGCSLTEKIKGVEKGNTHLNQACVRAERLALDRQYPGEMPQDVEIIDERYIEGDYKVVDVKPEGTTESEVEAAAARQTLKNGGEVSVGTYLGKVDGKPVYYGYDSAGKKIEGDQEPSAEEQDANRVLGTEPTHWCKEHNCAFQLKKSRFGEFYSHKVKGGWCNEKKEEEAASKPDQSALGIKVSGKCPSCGEEVSTVDEEDTACSNCGVIIHWQGSTLWVEEPEADPEAEAGVEEAKPIINLEWLKESLETLRATKLQAWSESNLLVYMKATYNIEAKTVLEGAAKLDKGQAAHFVKRVQDTLDMA